MLLLIASTLRFPVKNSLLSLCLSSLMANELHMKGDAH